MTNATKAGIITLVNAVLAALTAFDVALTDKQQSAIVLLANAILGLWVSLTYKSSAKRVPD